MKRVCNKLGSAQSAKLLFTAIVTGGAGVAFDAAGASSPGIRPMSNVPVYSVVNLGSSPDTAVLNQRDQVVFTVYNAGSPDNRFFDGRRISTIAAPGGRYTYARGLNKLGIVVGEFDDAATPQPFNYRSFSWTINGGLRPLDGLGNATALAINDRNQAVGYIHADAFYARANRWNQDGTQTRLGPVPATMSEAVAINNGGMSIGDADVARYDSRATVWDAAGTATDLGKMGGKQSVASYVNASGQVVGLYFADDFTGGQSFSVHAFMWTCKDGVTTFGPPEWKSLTVEALNDLGEVAGNKNYSEGPYIWSKKRGFLLLPMGATANGRVQALNNRSEMVGSAQLSTGDGTAQHAVRWNGVADPVDLNTRLDRAPAGLVITSARAINDSGAILADSNAGLVLLRPGRGRASAPVLGQIAASVAGDSIALNSTADFTTGFVGILARATHAASASVDDGCPQAAPTLREVRGTGDVSIRHTFCRPGVFRITVKVSESGGESAQVERQLFVSAPGATTLMGRGALASLVGQPARPGTVPLNFVLYAPLDANTRPSASATAPGFLRMNGQFRFDADLTTPAAWHGAAVQLSGTGRLNGREGYRFSIDVAPDADASAAAEHMRLRISHTDAGTNGEVVDYDNGAGPARAAALTANTQERTRLVRGSLWFAGPTPAQ